jgi:hypothetical protein
MTSYSVPQHIAGDTWKGISDITITRNGSAIDLTGAYAEFNVKYQIDAPTVVQFNTTNGTMMLVQPASSGQLIIPPQIVDVPPGNYIISLRVTLSSGEVDTFLTGNWPIVRYT